MLERIQIVENFVKTYESTSFVIQKKNITIVGNTLILSQILTRTNSLLQM